MVRLGPAAASASYLDPDAVVAGRPVGRRATRCTPATASCRRTRALARACAAAGIVFVGPTAGVARGGRATSCARDARAGRRAAGRAGRRGGRPRRRAGGRRRASGYPLLVKAVGRRWRPRHEARARPGRSRRTRLDLAVSEAAAAFGDPRVYLERFVAVRPARRGAGARRRRPRVVHLGDRDCSVQRRYQKLIEEAPAPRLGRRRCARRCADAALSPGRAPGLPRPGHRRVPRRRASGETFYFLEMNARIQVEHPVTEAVTGLDLVAEQIAVAEGQPLRLRQEDVRPARPRDRVPHQRRGLGARLPAVTRPDRRGSCCPVGEGLRVDTHVQARLASVPPYYDSLLAKLIVHGADRADALARAARGARPAADRGRRPPRCRVHQALLADAASSPPEEWTPPSSSGCWHAPDPTWWGCADGRRRDSSTSRCGTATRACGGPPGLRDRARRCRSRRCWTGSASGRWTSSSSTAMGVAVRIHREDPWERIRLTRAAMPTTKLQFIGTGFRFISWENAHPETMQLVYDRLVVNGDRPRSSCSTRCTTWTPPGADRPDGSSRPAIDEVVGALTYTISAGARRRLLRRPRPADGGVPGHRPRLHQGPGRHPDRRSGPAR